MSQEKARHPLLVWLLIVGTGFVVMARAMSLPFLAIYLHQRMGLDAASIGLLLGTGALVGTFGGHLSDVLGRRKVLIGCLLVSSLSFAALHFAADAWQVFAVNLFINLASSFYEPVSKATISDNLPPEQRLRAFARRYVAINVGFAIGPLLGASLGLLDKSPVFLITGAVYLLFSIAIYAITARLVFGSPPHGAAASDLPLAAKLRIIGTDRRLILFTAGSMLAIAVHGEMSVTFSQYLIGAFDDGLKMFAWLMSTNAITVVLSQPFLNRIGERRGPFTSLTLGAILLAIGAAGFANSPNMTALVVSMVVFTWGEVLRSRRNTPSSTASRPSRCAASITARIRSATSATCSAHGSAASHCCTTAAPRCSTRWASSRC
ncbi:MDR family MFS transporter [Burkholderia oklahomensis]|uniref:Sugar (And other) transporter family protein n=1 Tax=Burkholderia oklahomensis TaxID=342113 RepID=A0AAI8B7Y1_9BURK|nr:MFS transporter [Burkholderia oklahomensis]AIO67803.1 sugar (and other) transporter family protein [Burkholderia oklahomensis]AOI42324.1 MFS transporter permease [Burkholderia oklahomensis EO147]KUY52748.1 MFS transporter permease [Burkholderia oklahomensis EO147]